MFGLAKEFQSIENAIENAYGPYKERVKERYLDFLKTMPLAARTATRIFISHSTPEGRDAGAYSLAFFRRARSAGELVI